MKEEKAYKLLSLQENISNNKAKELIDMGVVYAKGEKITIARALMKVDTTFKIQRVEKIKIIYEDKNMLVLDKPAYLISENIAKKYNLKLLHRLDKETSGVLILCKNEEFRIQAIDEFKKMNVEKTYHAVVYGSLAEDIIVNSPIQTTKTKQGAYSKISQNGKEAISEIYPLMIEGKRTFVKVDIKTGKTHQIRVHLQSISHPILGDLKYGSYKHARLMLHASKLKIFDKTFTSALPSEFSKLGFHIN